MPRTNRTWRVARRRDRSCAVSAACGSSARSRPRRATRGQKEYSIAFVGPLTGDTANLGINIRNGAKIAVEEFNKANPDVQDHAQGVRHPGRPGPGPEPSPTSTSATTAILGIVGPAFSGETKAVLPTLEETGLVMISASATNAALPDVVPEQQGLPPGAPRRRRPGRRRRRSTSTTKLKPKTIAHRPRQQRVRQGPRGRPALQAARAASRSSTPRPSTRRARTSRPRSTR